MSKALIHSRLLEVLSYEPATGAFTRTATGESAGYFRSNDGYIGISVDGRGYLAHRLAWFYVTGAWPENKVDHRNCTRDDNRWTNLRHASDAVNAQNIRKAKNTSRTGVLGVSPDASGGFRAQIGVPGNRTKYLGIFPTVHAGHVAYVLAKRQLHEGNTL